MLSWRAAFLVLLLIVSGFAMAPMVEETAMEEPPMDDMDDMPQEHENETEDEITDGEPSMDDMPQQHESETEELITDEQLRKLHAKIDADANSKLSLDEMLHFYNETQHLAAAKDVTGIMEELDGNKDGKLGLDELKHAYGEDEDGGHDEQTSGYSRKELKAREHARFKMADQDNDGLLNQKEAEAFFHPNIHETVLQIATQHTMDEKDEDKDGFLTIEELLGSMEGGPEAYGDDLQMFQRLDRDESGKLDTKELLPWESGRFHVLHDMQSFMHFADTDGDVHLTIEELTAMHGNEDHNAQHHFMEMIQHHEL